MLVVLAVWCLSAVSVASPPSNGLAAWVYDTKGGQPAMWAADIGAFNKRPAKTAINVVWSYGGDMEYYPSSSQPYQTYFPAQSQQAATTYEGTHGVDYVMTVIDGRMDGGASYSPDLSKLTDHQIRTWANVTAELYCSYDQVSGIQLDLEPFSGKYKAPFLVYLKELSANLRARDFNCVSATHPQGRSVSTFMFASAATSDVWSALGPNGFLVISGYDLSSAPAGTPSSVQEYTSQLEQSVDDIVASASAHGGSFYLGIPAAASAHEFEQFVFANGTTVKGSPQLDFVKAALQVGKNKGLDTNPAFLGFSLWGFASEMAYPPHSQNLFHPNTPFVDNGAEDFLAANLWS